MFSSQPTDEQLLQACIEPAPGPTKKRAPRRKTKTVMKIAIPLPPPTSMLDNCTNPMTTPLSPAQDNEAATAAANLLRIMEEDQAIPNGQRFPSSTETLQESLVSTEPVVQTNYEDFPSLLHSTTPPITQYTATPPAPPTLSKEEISA